MLHYGQMLISSKELSTYMKRKWQVNIQLAVNGATCKLDWDNSVFCGLQNGRYLHSRWVYKLIEGLKWPS